jgi:hypothetical protein
MPPIRVTPPSPTASVGPTGGSAVPSAPPLVPTRKKGGGGVGGFLSNLGHDVEASLLGLPRGVVQAVEHPVDTAKAIGSQYEQTYGPLTHGDVSGFLHQLYEHPLGPILDVTTLVTGGAGAFARAGKIAADAGLIGADSKLAKLGEAGSVELRNPAALAQAGKLKTVMPTVAQAGAKTIAKTTSRNPARRAAQNALDRAMKLTPAMAPLVGEGRRFAREVNRDRSRLDAALRVQIRDYDHAASKLHDPRDQFAAALHIAGDDPRGWAALLEREHGENLPPQVSKTIAFLRDKQTADAFDHPTEQVQRVVDMGREIAHGMTGQRVKDAQSQLETALTQIDEREAAGEITAKDARALKQSTRQTADARIQELHDRPYLNLRLQAGARFVHPIKSDALASARSQAARLQKRYDAAARRRAKGIAKLPYSEADARARLAEIDQRYEQLVGAMTEMPAATKYLTAKRNADAAKRARRGLPPEPTVSEQARRYAEQKLAKALRENPNHPVGKEVNRLLDEAQRIRAGLAALAEQRTLGRLEGNGATRGSKLQALGRVGESGLTEGEKNVRFAGVKTGERDRLGGALSVAKDRVQQLEKRIAKQHGVAVTELRHREQLSGPSLFGPPESSVEAIRSSREVAGLPQPAYFPHKPIVGKVHLERSGGGVGVPKAEGALKQNQAVLYLTARIAQDPRALTTAYLGYVRSQLFQYVHGELEAHAVRVPVGDGIPSGWRYIRRPNERVPLTEKVQGDVMERLNELVSEDAAFDGLVTGAAAEAAGEGDYRLAVPAAFARELAGEFARSTSTVRALWEKPLEVWRAIVLGLRPAFFGNNVIGNNLLLALRFAGPNGVDAYLRVLGDMRGPRVVKQLLSTEAKDPATVRALGKPALQRLVEKYAPELIQGTFGRSQFPTALPGGAVGRRAAQALSQGIGPLTAKVAEDIPRRAGFVAAITPAVRAAMKADGKHFLERLHPDTETFARYAELALDRDPALAREAVGKVNAALGDYLNLSDFEKTTVRQLIPFYAWLRSIAIITAKAAAETPGRSAVIVRLGQIGAALNEEQFGQLPTFLRGVIPLGPGRVGRVPVLTTTGLNPLSSAVDVEHAVTGLVHGRPGEFGAAIGTTLNPFVQSAIEGTHRAESLERRAGQGHPRRVARKRHLRAGVEAAAGHADAGASRRAAEARNALSEHAEGSAARVPRSACQEAERCSGERNRHPTETVMEGVESV